MRGTTDNGKGDSSAIRRIPVGTRYPEDRAELLDVLKVRRRKSHRSDIVAEALDRLLIAEGLLEAA